MPFDQQPAPLASGADWAHKFNPPSVRREGAPERQQAFSGAEQWFAIPGGHRHTHLGAKSSERLTLRRTAIEQLSGARRGHQPKRLRTSASREELRPVPGLTHPPVPRILSDTIASAAASICQPLSATGPLQGVDGLCVEHTLRRRGVTSTDRLCLSLLRNCGPAPA